MKKYVYIAQSVDGFIAKSDGNLDWLDHDSLGEDYGFKNFMENIDVLLMGANTFRAVMNFDQWVYEGKKVFVLSSSLRIDDVPEKLKSRIELTSLSPKKIISQLADEGHLGIYIDGGKLIQSFLKEDLIDEIIITQIPILLGGGISLFGNLDREIKLRHTETKSFKSGLVQSIYKISHK